MFGKLPVPKSIASLDARFKYYREVVLRIAAAALPLGPARRLVIINRGRSGSNLLMSLLNSHPEIRVRGEVVGESALRKEYVKRTINSLGPVPYLRQRFARAGFESIAGVKILYYQLEQAYADRWNTRGLPDIPEYLQSQKNILVIHLKRRNILKTLVSFRTAAITKQYVTNRRVVSAAAPIKIRLTPEECETEFQRTREWERYYDELFQNHRLLEIYYEDLVKNREEVCARILTFLDVAPRSLQTQSKKLRKRPVSELVENYAELKTHFADTQWAEFFDE